MFMVDLLVAAGEMPFVEQPVFSSQQRPLRNMT